MNLCDFAECLADVDGKIRADRVDSILQVCDYRNVRVRLEVRHELLDCIKQIRNFSVLIILRKKLG